MPMCLILLLVVGPSLHLFNDRYLYAKSSRDNSRVSQLQRLGTTNILDPPDDISIILSDHNNSTLDDQFDEQFIILGNNLGTRQNLAVSNPDYELSTANSTFVTGEKFIIDSSTDADIMYSKAAVKLVPITSAFPPPHTDVADVDPESDIQFGTPINLGNYTGGFGNFVMPHTASSGYYLLYVYLYYPTYNLTAVYNVVVQLKGGSATKS
ncbi:MAG: hypothetical protein WBQ25_02500 [Nitrososphaeraceae archaeon]